MRLIGLPVRAAPDPQRWQSCSSVQYCFNEIDFIDFLFLTRN